jgi:hypothetical protein
MLGHGDVSFHIAVFPGGLPRRRTILNVLATFALVTSVQRVLIF